MTISVLGACTPKTNITPYSPTNSKEELVSKLLADLPEMTKLEMLASFCADPDFMEDPGFHNIKKFFKPSIVWRNVKKIGFRDGESQIYGRSHSEICLIELSSGEFFELEIEQYKNGQWYISQKTFEILCGSSLRIGQQNPTELISEVVEILDNEDDLKEIVQFSSLCWEEPDRINWQTLRDSLKVDLWEEAQLLNIVESSDSDGNSSGSAIATIELSNDAQVQLLLGEIPLSKNWVIVFEESWYTNNHSSHYGKKRNY